MKFQERTQFAASPKEFGLKTFFFLQETIAGLMLSGTHFKKPPSFLRVPYKLILL